MNKYALFNIALLILCTASTAAFGQYTGSNPNIALFKPASASDSVVGYEPGKAVDGLTDDFCAIPGLAPAWLQIDLVNYYYIDGYELILPNLGTLPLAYTFQVSEDGSTWTDLITDTISVEGTYGFDLVSPDPVRYVRLFMSSKDAWTFFAEISVFGVEMEPPLPPVAENAYNITDTGFTFKWNESAGAEGYVVRLATDGGFNHLVPGYEDYWVGGARRMDFTGLDPGITYFYKVRAYNLAGTSDYGKKLSVTTLQGSQTITFDTLIPVIYGDADFDLTASASSALAITYTSTFDTVATVNGSTVTILGVGTTTIIAEQAGDAQYPAATPVSRDLIVSRKDLIVDNASTENKVYDGNTSARLSGAVLTGVVGNDDVTLIGGETGTFTQSGVGSGIEVMVSMSLAGKDTGNYSLVQPGGFLADITARELMVSADDQSREQCAANPEWTLSYSGFAAGEDISVLESEPAASCSADENSPEGSYDILTDGGSAANYTFTYLSGTLTVTADLTPPVLFVQNFTIQLDGEAMGSITAADLVSEASDNCSLADTTLSQYEFSGSDMGDVNVEVTLSDAAGNSITETAVVTVLGYVGNGKAESLCANLYPNPTHGLVNLELDRHADEMAVLDITGKSVIRLTDPGQDVRFDLSAYPGGVYLVQLKFGDEVSHFKVVKK